jgi:hypothetical protein
MDIFTCSRNISECKTFHFSDLHYCASEVTEKNMKKLYILPKECSGSDLSGDAHSRSNYEILIRKYIECDGVHKIEGENNTYGVVIRYDTYENDSNIKNAVNLLERGCSLS